MIRVTQISEPPKLKQFPAQKPRFSGLENVWLLDPSFGFQANADSHPYV